ncbi:MAG TPA: hypothetical protein VEI97_13085, partial [bacterium]|nr:hypothetical protein [bacterium]
GDLRIEQGPNADWRVVGEDGPILWGLGSRAYAEQQLQALTARQQPKAAEVWSLDVTPEMKASVMQGQHLGQVTAGPLLAMGGASIGGILGSQAEADDHWDRTRNTILGMAGGAALPFLATGAFNVLKGPKPEVPLSQLIPDPQVRARLKQTIPFPGTLLRDRAAKALKVVTATVKDTFRAENELREAGYGEAAEALLKYKSDYLDIAGKAHGHLKGVLKDLRTPGEFEQFWALVALRHDLNTIRQGLEAEAGLHAPQVESALASLEAAVDPRVLDAAQRHKDLMRQIGERLVARGHLHPDTITRWGHYFPDYVLDYVLQAGQSDVTVRPGRRQPITPGTRGYLMEREGGTRETLRDYAKATLKYLTQVEEGFLKDDLVKTVTDQYAAQVPQPGQGFPPGYDLWTYGRGGQTYLLPKVIADRLRQWYDPPSAPVDKLLKGFRTINNTWKGLALRAAWGGFTTMNYLGDVWWSFMSTPFWKWDDVARTLVEAGTATADLMRGESEAGLRAAGQGARADNLYVAELGRKTGLGTGAATTELANLRKDPHLRQLLPPQETLFGKLVGKALGGPGQRVTDRAFKQAADWVRGAEHVMDTIREWTENAPRLAEFMRQLEAGTPPQHAGRITRKVMIDYSDLSPTEETYFRGFLFPFYAFYKHNFARHIPGIAPDAMRAATATVQGLGVVALATAFNEWMNPEIERGLKPWEKNQLHFNVPIGVNPNGGVDYLILMVADPLTLAMSTVGMGGLP